MSLDRASASGRFGITATVSPRGYDAGSLAAFERAGATRLRLNASHADPPALERFLHAARVAHGRGELTLPLVFDLQGAKRRLGDFPPVPVRAGDAVVLFEARASGGDGRIPVPHPGIFREARAEQAILIDDGRIELRVREVAAAQVACVAMRGGTISPRKGITIVGARVATFDAREARPLLDALAPFARAGLPPCQLALSFVRDAEDLAALREAAPGYPVIAKVETRAAFERLDGILDAADETWLCRGDLGAEAGLPALPALEIAFRAAAAASGRPWTMAGEVLHPLADGQSLTRTEYVYLAGLAQAGAAGVVLSDETVRSADPCAPVAAARAFLEAYRSRR